MRVARREGMVRTHRGWLAVPLAVLLLAGCALAEEIRDAGLGGAETRTEVLAGGSVEVSQLRASIEAMEAWAEGEAVTYRDVLPVDRPPLLTSMSSSGYGETGMTVAFSHQDRQSFLLHVGKAAELPECSDIESTGDPGRYQCVRREVDAPRPFLIYLVAPDHGDAAPDDAQLVAFWQAAELASYSEPPPWAVDR